MRAERVCSSMCWSRTSTHPELHSIALRTKYPNLFRAYFCSQKYQKPCNESLAGGWLSDSSWSKWWTSLHNIYRHIAPCEGECCVHRTTFIHFYLGHQAEAARTLLPAAFAFPWPEVDRPYAPYRGGVFSLALYRSSVSCKWGATCSRQ